jgi:tetratricopeptide (TPR) repeat protein
MNGPPTEGIVFQTKMNWIRPQYCAVLAMIALTTLVYLPVLRNGFIFDDGYHVTQNAMVRHPAGVGMIWTSFLMPCYYPITFTTFWLIYQLWGPNPLPFHAITLMFHIINAVVVFFILRRLKICGAWVIAAIWAIHPVNVESVAWIAELKNTLSGTFFFLSILSYLRFECEPESRWFDVSLLCFAAALLSKSATVVLPAVLLACCWWQRGRLTRVDLLRSRHFIALALVAAVVAIYGELRENWMLGEQRDWSLAWPERLIVAGKDLWFYIGKVLWPRDLIFSYPRWTHQAATLMEWVPLIGAAMVGVLLACFRQANWRRAILFGVGYFTIALFPVLGFFDQSCYRYAFVADHFQYLASIGIIALAVSPVAVAVHNRGPAIVLVVCVLFTFGVLSWRHCHVFRDDETLWHDTLAKNPQSFLAHNNLGWVYKDRHEYEQAAEYFRQALRLKPVFFEARNNLGSTLTVMGRYDEALEQLQNALRIAPNSADAHNNLGVALAMKGSVEEAITHFAEAVRLRPDFADAAYNLQAARQVQQNPNKSSNAQIEFR